MDKNEKLQKKKLKMSLEEFIEFISRKKIRPESNLLNPLGHIDCPREDRWIQSSK